MKSLPEWINVTWIIAVAIIGLSFFLGGRLESPSQKEARVRGFLAPIEQKLEYCNQTVTELKIEFKHHRELGGHPKMEARMQTVEKSLSVIQADIKTILQKLD
jgi:hypothetical protein